MRRILLGAVIVLAVAPALWALDAQDKPKPDTPATPAEQFKALVAEETKLQQGYSQALRSATTTEERQQAFKDYSAKRVPFPGRFLELAKKNPKDPVALDALARVVMSRTSPEAASEALELLTKNYVENEKLAPVVDALMSSSDPAAEKFLRVVVERSPNAKVQGRAAFSLASQLKSRAARRGTAESEVIQLNQEAERFFDQVVTKYADADLRNSRGEALAAVAKRELFELRHLSVGREVPEIAGEDTDGQKFKLSDYRGKVVFLDFWGHW